MATYSNAIKKIKKIYFDRNGSILAQYGDPTFNAQDDEIAVLQLYIEDGVTENATTLINYTPEKRTAYTSHWFFCSFRELVDEVMQGEIEPRSFAKFETIVPSPVLLENEGKTALIQKSTVIQRYGNFHIGNFATLTALETANPADEELATDGNVAYVYGDGSNNGFYQVEEVESVYTWVLKTSINYTLTLKQYNLFTINVGRGFANPQGVPTVAQSTIYQLMQEISNTQVRLNTIELEMDGFIADVEDLQDQIDDVVDGTTPITFDKTGTNLDAETLPDAIKEVNDRTNANEQNISDMKDGTDAFTEILLSDGNGGTLRITYDGKDPIFTYRGITGEAFKNLFGEAEPASGVTFTHGMPIMYAGSIGGSGKRLAKPTVLSELAVNPNLFLGIVTEVTNDGHAIYNWYGVVNNLNTSGLTSGSPLYVGEGALTATKPTKPLPTIRVGLVERVNSSVGQVSVRPDIGRYLGDLHNVYVNGSEVDGITIMYNGTTSRYEVYDLKGNILRIDGVLEDLEERVEVLETQATTIYDYKGSVLFENLPTTGQKVGDAYNITNDFILGGQDYLAGTNVAWNGSGWDALASRIPNASHIGYDNTTSGLDAENVQEAIDELQDEKVAKADIVDNLTTDDATKVLSAKQGKALQDTKEALANKAVDFSVINDMKYPTTKAIAERLLNLPIAELNNHTLREVYTENETSYTINNVNFDNYWFRVRTPEAYPHTFYRAERIYDGITSNTLYFSDGSISFRWITETETLTQIDNTLFYDKTITYLFDVDGINAKKYIIDMGLYGINSVSNERMLFWYQVFKAINLNGSLGMVFNHLITFENEYRDNYVEAKLLNKNIVCFGDSITADSAYIDVMKETLKANVYNQGYSSGRMAYNSDAIKNSFSLFNLWNSIVSEDYTLQDTTLFGVSGYETQYEAVQRLKLIDFNTVDIITISLGTNDWVGSVPLDDNLLNEFDTTNFYGATRYVIKKILDNFPHIKIMIISPIYRFEVDIDGLTILNYAETFKVNSLNIFEYSNGILDIAKDFNLPRIDMCKNLGINKYNCVYYFKNNSNTYDGTHPNINGKRLMGKLISGELTKQF